MESIQLNWGNLSLKAGLYVVLFAIVPAVHAQSFDFRQDTRSLHLNGPEVGAFSEQIRKELGQGLFQALPKASAPAPGTPVIDPRKSIFITDENIMKKITFADVMEQLAKQGGDPKTDKLALFKQWWDSQTTAPGMTTGPHCNTLLSDFHYDCPRQEAAEAKIDPFIDPAGDDGYSAIAYSNRPDLADPARPVDCGEARIVFAKNSGKKDSGNRNLIIFEARLLNPKPSLGLAGCVDIQRFWEGLSGVDQKTRGEQLKDFFLNGLPTKSIPPVVHIDNYALGAGQIRTNQFINRTSEPGPSGVWTLREFKIQKLQPGLRIIPVTVKINPDPSLFAGTGPIDLQARFLGRLSEQFDNLRGNGNEASSAAFGLRLLELDDDAFNPLEGNEIVDTTGSISKVFNDSSLVGTFVARKLNELKKPGSTGTRLTPADIAVRIETQTCAGCHHWSNGKDLGGGAGRWPHSIMFTHESESPNDMDDSPEPGGGKRFGISETVKSNGFIPLRCVAMSRILNVDSTPCGFTP
jgi:hypothetical protein